MGMQIPGLRAWLNRWIGRAIRAELASDIADVEAIYAAMEARGEKPRMTDVQYDELKCMAEEAGPESMERFKRLSHLVGRQMPDDGISESESRSLLNVLCAKYGFCLPALWRARLEKNPPKSIDKFTDTVFRAEGLDPTTCDKSVYESVREEVRLAFQRSLSNP